MTAAWNFEKVGFAHVPNLAGDVWVHSGFAYVGSWQCERGVNILDVRNLSEPVSVGSLPAAGSATYEDVVVIRAETEAFQGDLLVTGAQRCGPDFSNTRGFEFWDVSDPRDPVKLSFFPVGNQSGVHELHMFQHDGRVLVVGAVPRSDESSVGDIRILDASDPRQPRQLVQWDPLTAIGLKPEEERRGQSPSVLCHSIITN